MTQADHCLHLIGALFLLPPSPMISGKLSVLAAGSGSSLVAGSALAIAFVLVLAPAWTEWVMITVLHATRAACLTGKQ